MKSLVFRLSGILIVLVSIIVLSAPVADARKSGGDVYLLRGLNDVFSKGLDQMARKMKNSGIDAKVINHTAWRSALDDITANHKRFGKRPVVLIGHSLGGNAIISIAEALGQRRIRVNYLVTFDATSPAPIPANVSRATNYYQASGSFGEPLRKGPGFRGRLSNVDLSSRTEIGHFNIEKQSSLHRKVIATTRRLLR